MLLRLRTGGCVTMVEYTQSSRGCVSVHLIRQFPSSDWSGGHHVTRCWVSLRERIQRFSGSFCRKRRTSDSDDVTVFRGLSMICHQDVGCEDDGCTPPPPCISGCGGILGMQFYYCGIPRLFVMVQCPPPHHLRLCPSLNSLSRSHLFLLASALDYYSDGRSYPAADQHQEPRGLH